LNELTTLVPDNGKGARLNILRLTLAAIGGFVAYMVLGGLIFQLIPSVKAEFLKYPAIYRDQNGQMSHMPIGMAGMLLSMAALAVLYALLYQGGSGLAEGARFGALIGLFFVGSFVVHNYVNLNIRGTISVQQGIAYFIQWTVVGVVIGLIYKPLAGH
jgi:hypothetical protein